MDTPQPHSSNRAMQWHIMKDGVDVICFKMLDDLPAIKIVADKDIIHVSIVIASQWDYWTAQQPGFLQRFN